MKQNSTALGGPRPRPRVPCGSGAAPPTAAPLPHGRLDPGPGPGRPSAGPGAHAPPAPAAAPRSPAGGGGRAGGGGGRRVGPPACPRLRAPLGPGPPRLLLRPRPSHRRIQRRGLHTAPPAAPEVEEEDVDKVRCKTGCRGLRAPTMEGAAEAAPAPGCSAPSGSLGRLSLHPVAAAAAAPGTSEPHGPKMAAPRLPLLPPAAGSDGTASRRSPNQRGRRKPARLLLLGATRSWPGWRRRRPERGRGGGSPWVAVGRGGRCRRPGRSRRSALGGGLERDRWGGLYGVGGTPAVCRGCGAAAAVVVGPGLRGGASRFSHPRCLPLREPSRSSRAGGRRTRTLPDATGRKRACCPGGARGWRGSGRSPSGPRGPGPECPPVAAEARGAPLGPSRGRAQRRLQPGPSEMLGLCPGSCADPGRGAWRPGLGVLRMESGAGSSDTDC